ncbi:MAG: ABC transporter ATP-binding protein [Spirochaetia bacterium]|jgi:ATP-binding cassette subfamily B protein|nr:ABC transporter ATP-binding protein [Spirochaetia bacterium]
MIKEYKTLYPYVKKYFISYLFGLFFLVITDGGQLVIPQMIRKAVDMIASGVFDLNRVGTLMLAMIGVAAAIAFGRFGWRFFIQGSSRRIENELRENLFQHLLKLSSTYFNNMKTGDIMSRFTNDMHNIRMATGMALVAFVDGVFMTLVILIILFKQYPSLAGFTIMPLPVVFLIVLGAGRLMGPRFQKVQDSYGHISDEAQETLSGIRVIKTFVREKHFLTRFASANEEYLKSNLALVKIWGFLFPVITFLSGLTTLLLLWFGGSQVMGGTLSPGDFVAVLSYLGMLIWPMIGAGFTINLLNRGAASLNRINQVLNEVPDITSLPGADGLIHPGELEVKNLTYSFPDGGGPALADISFKVLQGQTLGILGETGSGKSTLLRLLPRLLDVPEGTVFYGGRDIREYTLPALRGMMASVPQNTFLFSDTVKANIAFGTGETHAPHDPHFKQNEQDALGTSDVLLKEMAHLSTIDRDLSSFPEGWNTTVGEKGVTLSGGQKQRISISRALASAPEVLIFDDALSAVDTETEEKILNNLIALRSGKTNIIVSHRVSTLMKADLVLVLKKGRIAQKGSPEELLKEDGIFRRVYNLQQICRHGDCPEDNDG